MEVSKAFSQNPIDCGHDSFHRHAQDALRLFKLGAKVTMAWLARQLMADDLVWLCGPGPPMRDIGRPEDHNGRSPRSGGNVRDATVISHKQTGLRRQRGDFRQQKIR